MRFTPLFALASAGFIAVACSSSSGSDTTPGDASADTSTGTDSGGTDSTLPGNDAGDQDTSTPDDSGGADAQKDTGPACPTPTGVDYAGCVEADAGAVDAGGIFVDVGANDTSITYQDNGNYGGDYTPNCIKIKANQTVTWTGLGFALHPLRPAPCNPTTGDQIPSMSTGTQTSLKFMTPGTYGFHCSLHGGGADPHSMKGVIVVY